jgi:hypothetical protein
METRTQRVVLETKQHQIIGDVTLPREGYLSRFSDFLNQSEVTFVAVTNVTMIKRLASGATETMEREFIAVGINHIEVAYPDE